ncbi:MAG TPA: transcriptional repressor [Candidatus Margulisiibacteriota bacterium]|nr:transcriptional repressor [Candidatus Margulisiibacteriota bacterium]
MKERRTRQLAAVEEVVNAAHDHPSAEEVYRRVRRKLPRVSLGTVYRNLQKLAAQQRIRVVQLAESATRYDGMLEEHDHFMCERCGAVSDLLRKHIPAPRLPPLHRVGYVVRRHALTYYGICPKCRDTPVHRRSGAALH